MGGGSTHTAADHPLHLGTTAQPHHQRTKEGLQDAFWCVGLLASPGSAQPAATPGNAPCTTHHATVKDLLQASPRRRPSRSMKNNGGHHHRPPIHCQNPPRCPQHAVLLRVLDQGLLGGWGCGVTGSMGHLNKCTLGLGVVSVREDADSGWRCWWVTSQGLCCHHLPQFRLTLCHRPCFLQRQKARTTRSMSKTGSHQVLNATFPQAHYSSARVQESHHN